MIALLLAVSIESNALILHDACFRQGSVLSCSALAGSNSLAAEPSSPTAASPAKSPGGSEESPLAASGAAPLESIADDLVADGIWIGLASAADLGSTAYALRNCAACYELNPLTPDVESRIAIKAAMYPAAMGISYWMRRKGWKSQANGFRWGVVAILGAVSINNIVTAHRGN